MAMPSYTPVRKVSFAGATGVLVSLVVALLNRYVLPADLAITGDISGMATTLLSFVVAYLIPPGIEEAVAIDPATGATQSAVREPTGG
jgi:hypothetical protein